LGFRGHVMGIPADYNDKSFATRCNFRPPNWVPKPVMLSILTDWVAMQECVRDNAKGPRLANVRLSEKGGITAKVAAKVDVRAPPVEQNQLAPIKMVSKRVWSLGIYRALRLLGKSLDIAWERAFICPLTFN
jgi:hypothetical protein